ncbi:hypothetical protein, partial [Streptomyces minutiscleroticus]|uniref:hypothetical protein n=1 Tax=Streptomyces minutiscleroticus TaxID=68238 RepID=UPI00333382EA
DPGGPVSGSVFKVERGAAGERIAYVRMFSGTDVPGPRVDIQDDRSYCSGRRNAAHQQGDEALLAFPAK